MFSPLNYTSGQNYANLLRKSLFEIWRLIQILFSQKSLERYFNQGYYAIQFVQVIELIKVQTNNQK